ncbi:MAG TPA: hypothetical protein VFA12_14150 [Stellaceae bacterium]|nr:hypothetical protein [Stellaceae bacterium]
MKVDAKEAGALPFVIAWLLMVGLVGLSVWTAFLPIGVWSPIIEFTVAAAQTATIFILFMRLKGPPSLKWLAAGTGFFWLLFLYGLSMTDYTTRSSWPS